MKRVWAGGKYVTICSIYLSPSINFHKSDITSITDQLPRPYLLLGDMNARHPVWGEPSQSINSNGRAFNDLLSEQDFGLLNSCEKTHYSSQHGTHSLIDLSIASIDCINEFTIKVHQNLYNSDHYPIEIEKCPEPIAGEPSLKFQFDKADWGLYKNLTQTFSPPPESDSIDEKVEKLNAHLLTSAQASIPTSHGRTNGKIPIPWFNAECKQVHRERKRAERALQRNHTTANLIAFIGG